MDTDVKKLELCALLWELKMKEHEFPSSHARTEYIATHGATPPARNLEISYVMPTHQATKKILT